MKKVLLYLFLFLLLASTSTVLILNNMLEIQKILFLPLLCSLAGLFGGLTYCLRGVYINYCVRQNWDKNWHLWYYIRPIISFLMGGISYIFLKAGLLILDTSRDADSSIFGFLALAFIAGLNVDKFVSKLENVAEATFGIEKSRAAKDSFKMESDKVERKNSQS